MSKPVHIKGLSDAAATLVRAALETADPQGVEPRIARERIMGAKASIEVKNDALWVCAQASCLDACFPDPTADCICP